VTILAVALPVTAQEKGGTIQGQVVDNDGIVLPGVIVVVSGENMMGDRSTVTDANGEFRFPMIPPGLYDISASLASFQPIKKEGVPVTLGNVANIAITLQPGFGDTIEVVSESFLIDTTSSKVGANITKEFLSEMPTDRQYQMVMSILPGAVEANNPYMHGASGGDNMYLIDGADSSDPSTRTWSSAINFDNIQEVQVQTGGINAEYGKGTGAVVNMVTKSGSNEFHGTARFHITDVDWNSEAKGDSYYFSDATRYITEDRWSASLGGRIVRDHLWFFGSYETRGKTLPTAYWNDPQDLLDAGETGDVAGNITNSESPYEGYYGQVKLTWSPSAAHQGMIQYMDDPIDIPQLYAYIGYSSRSPSADNLREQGGYNVMANWTWVATDNGFLDLRYNQKRNALNNIPYGSGITYRITNSAGTIYYGNSTYDYRTERNHDIYGASWNQYVDDLAGDHSFKFGIEYSDIFLGQLAKQYPGGEYIRLYPDGETPYYRYVWQQYPGRLDTGNENWSFFVQDSWMVSSRLTLNIGLRLETLVDQTPQGYKALDWGIGDRIAPRLGFAYALGAKGDSNLHGFYGRYHDTIGNWVSFNFVEAPNEEYCFQYYDVAGDQWPDDYLACYSVGAANTNQFDLKSPYMDEFSLGFEGRITDTMSWSIDGIYRKWKQGIEDDDGQLFDEFPDNPPVDGNYVFANVDDVREYRGVELTLRKRLGGDKLQFLASYTWSDTESIWGDADESTVYADNPFNYYNYRGRPFYDYRHMFKINGSYFLPWGFVVGTYFSYWSEKPMTITADVQTSEESQWGGLEFGGYYPEPRGSRELPATYRWDLRLEKIFNLGRNMTLAIYADIFNVTDQQKPVDFNGYYGVIEIDEPGQQIDNNGVPVDTSGFEPAYDEWQAPRSYFFGAKFEF
jgi:hypothetical protein